jgi:uncharacterized protein YcbK (DUF882 family)
VYDNLTKLSIDFPGLIVTSATRTQKKQDELVKAGKGVKNSKHVGGKAVDFRLNSYSKKLLNLSKSELTAYGIEDVLMHHNHVHIEYI